MQPQTAAPITPGLPDQCKATVLGLDELPTVIRSMTLADTEGDARHLGR